MESLNQVILDELRDMRKNNDEFQAEILQRVTALETKLHPLIDNGQPGIITQLSSRVRKLENWRAYLAGISATVSALVGLGLKYFLR